MAWLQRLVPSDEDGETAVPYDDSVIDGGVLLPGVGRRLDAATSSGSRDESETDTRRTPVDRFIRHPQLITSDTSEAVPTQALGPDRRQIYNNRKRGSITLLENVILN